MPAVELATGGVGHIARGLSAFNSGATIGDGINKVNTGEKAQGAIDIALGGLNLTGTVAAGSITKKAKGTTGASSIHYDGSNNWTYQLEPVLNYTKSPSGGYIPSPNSRLISNSNGANGSILRTHKPINELLKDANTPYNETGLSQSARSWEKHAGRADGSFPPLKGTIEEKNMTVNNWINDLLRNPEIKITKLPRGGVEYKLPNGQAIVFEPNGKVNLRDPSWNKP